jgi:hypothetical protein
MTARRPKAKKETRIRMIMNEKEFIVMKIVAVGDTL